MAVRIILQLVMAAQAAGETDIILELGLHLQQAKAITEQAKGHLAAAAAAITLEAAAARGAI